MKNFFVFMLLLLPGEALFAQEPNSRISVKEPVFKNDTFNITRFGARADGLTLNTRSIAEAISACHKNGGGVVLVPKGFWLTGPIILLSNVNLCIDREALLQFTGDKDQFKLVEGNYEGLPAYRNQPPLSASNAENIAITGNGIIDGNGNVWRAVNHDKVSEIQWKAILARGGIVSKDRSTWYPSEQYAKAVQIKNPGVIDSGKSLAEYESIKDFLRPNLLVLAKCKRILLEGVTFENSPAWCLHLLICENITVRNIYAKNPSFAQNGDGIDVESCSNVLIAGSSFDVGDDGICIKSGRDEEGRKRGMPTQNVEIKNCVVYHAHGGFVIGSEMSGGAKDIYVHDCTFIGTDIGLRFKTARGRGGVVEKVYADNIIMKDIVNEAILFDMYYFAAPKIIDGIPQVEIKSVDETTPIFRDFHIDHIICKGASKAVFIRGLPEMPVSDITFDNLYIEANEGIDCSNASGTSFNNVHLLTKNDTPVITVVSSHDITFNNIVYTSGINLLIKISGNRTKNIKLIDTNTAKAKQLASFTAGAAEAALIKE